MFGGGEPQTVITEADQTITDAIAQYNDENF
jgi:hypothetical protein